MFPTAITVAISLCVQIFVSFIFVGKLAMKIRPQQKFCFYAVAKYFVFPVIRPTPVQVFRKNYFGGGVSLALIKRTVTVALA